MQEKKGEKKVFPVYLKWIVIIMCVYDSNSVFVLSNKDIKLIPSSFAVTLKKGFIWCAGVQKQNKKLWWFLIRLLGLLDLQMYFTKVTWLQRYLIRYEGM